MNRRDYALLGGLLAVGLAIRVVLFDSVGIWGDFGFYAYDARLIQRGQTPFIDFLGRSPLFLYLYAGVTELTGEYTRTLRWFAIFWYLVSAIPVYYIGHRLRGRRVAVAATGLFLLTPFSVAYGVRASTQSLALACSLAGVALLVRGPQRWHWPAAGGLLALGFLARQSMIALGAGVAAWGLLLWYEGYIGFRDIATRGLLFGGAFVVTTFVGYLAVVGSLGQAVALWDQQVIGLFATSGRGGLPLIGVEFPQIVSQDPSGRVPIINDVCPQCSSRTARVFASTTLAAAPVLVFSAWYLRDWTDRFFRRKELEYLGGILLVLAAYGVYKAIRAGYLYRPLGVVGLAVGAIVAFRGRRLPRYRLYSKTAVLLLCLTASLAFGYMVRDRLLANYYFLDLFPFVCLLAGLVAVLAYERVDRPGRVALTCALALLMVTSLFAAHPLANTTLTDERQTWFTTDKMDRYETDIDARTAPGEPVFSGHPTYLSDSHARMPMDDPRIHYRYSTFATRDGPQWPAAEMYDHVQPRLANGTYEWLILDAMSARVIQYGIQHDIFTGEVREQYCRVESADELYAETGAILYRYQPDGCATERPDWATLELVGNGDYNVSALA